MWPSDMRGSPTLLALHRDAPKMDVWLQHDVTSGVATGAIDKLTEKVKALSREAMGAAKLFGSQCVTLLSVSRACCCPRHSCVRYGGGSIGQLVLVGMSASASAMCGGSDALPAVPMPSPCAEEHDADAFDAPSRTRSAVISLVLAHAPPLTPPKPNPPLSAAQHLACRYGMYVKFTAMYGSALQVAWHVLNIAEGALAALLWHDPHVTSIIVVAIVLVGIASWPVLVVLRVLMLCLWWLFARLWPYAHALVGVCGVAVSSFNVYRYTLCESSPHNLTRSPEHLRLGSARCPTPARAALEVRTEGERRGIRSDHRGEEWTLRLATLARGGR